MKSSNRFPDLKSHILDPNDFYDVHLSHGMCLSVQCKHLTLLRFLMLGFQVKAGVNPLSSSLTKHGKKLHLSL